MSASTLNILVPYRNRQHHLDLFLPAIQQYLAGTDYKIWIIEQEPGKKFNRGKLLNIGAVLSKEGHICLHDVDKLPVADCDYSCPETIRHIFWRYYPDFLGGVTVFNRDTFFKINGFANGFEGWGREDDNLFERCAGINLEHKEGKWNVLADRMEDNDKSNHHGHNLDLYNDFKTGRKLNSEDGLNTLMFMELNREEHGNIVRVLARV